MVWWGCSGVFFEYCFALKSVCRTRETLRNGQFSGVIEVVNTIMRGKWYSEIWRIGGAGEVPRSEGVVEGVWIGGDVRAYFLNTVLR